METVKRLHDAGKYVSFYEFLDLKENASESQIKKAIRKARKTKLLTNMSKDEYASLINSIYTSLTTLRKEYDYFLRTSNYYFLDAKQNYKNYVPLLCFVMILFVLFLDGLVYLIRYLKYINEAEKYREKKAKKDEDGNNKKKMKYPTPPSTFIFSIFSKLFRRVFRL